MIGLVNKYKHGLFTYTLVPTFEVSPLVESQSFKEPHCILLIGNFYFSPSKYGGFAPSFSKKKFVGFTASLGTQKHICS
jgi:hypothetical protein